MNIDNLTIGEAKKLANMFGSSQSRNELNTMVGEKVIIRTNSAGVHYGELVEKAGEEVILKDARRLYYWKTTNKGISLSEVSKTGLYSTSKVCTAVDNIWLQAIEIIPCTTIAIKSIEAHNDYQV